MNSNLLIVVVLYECYPSDSRTLQTLRAAMKELNTHLRLVVVNNSRSMVVVSTDEFDVFQSDSNRGLAEPYDLAATLCLEEGIEYLITLDQDTEVTTTYLKSMIEKSQASSDKVGAYVPLIRNEHTHLSPGYYDIQKGLYQSHLPIQNNEKIAKLKSYEMPYAFNSGTMWSVHALKDCGGFPQRYALDMLDHAMFRRLYLKGWQMEVVDADHYLKHGLSLESKDGMSKGRAQNYLDAVHQYYIEEEMLKSYYAERSSEANLSKLGKEYMSFLFKMGMKRFVKGLLGKQIGYPTTEMYYEQLMKLKKADEAHSFVPFKPDILAKVTDYTSISKLKVF